MSIKTFAAFSLGAPLVCTAIPFGECPSINSSSLLNIAQNGLVLDAANNLLYNYTIEGVTETSAEGASTVTETLTPNDFTVQGVSVANVKNGYYILGSSGAGMLIQLSKTISTHLQMPAPPFLSSFALKYGLGAYAALDYNLSFDNPPGIYNQFYIGNSGTQQNSDGQGGYGLVAYSQSGEIITAIEQLTGTLRIQKDNAAYFFGSTDSSTLLNLAGESIPLPGNFVSCYYFGQWNEGDVWVLETANKEVVPVLYTGTDILTPLVFNEGSPVFTASSDLDSSSLMSTVGSTIKGNDAILCIADQTPAGWLVNLNFQDNRRMLNPFNYTRLNFCYCSESYRLATEAAF